MNSTLFATLLFISAAVSATTEAVSHPVGDGHLSLYNYHTGETPDIRFREKGHYNEQALHRLTHFLRSRSDNIEKPIDPLLIDLLDNIQDHFHASTIEIISGYRSPSLNRELKAKGNNVAEESLHLEGKAADIHIDEVTEESLRDYAGSLHAGGVGYYPKNDFVHVDVGEVRHWSLPDEPGRPLIAFQKGTVWQIITDKNVYGPNESITLNLENISNATKTTPPTIWIERFRNGKWETAGKFEPSKKTCAPSESVSLVWKPTQHDLYGKYRLKIPFDSDLPNTFPLSNEFYRKRM